jgi:MFS family permease
VPLLGTNGASIAVMCVGAATLLSRLGIGAVIDRLPPRTASAMSFVLQALSTAIWVGLSDHPWALYLGSILLGVAAGNMLTLPTLIIQREFPPALFGSVLGLAMAIVSAASALMPVVLGVVYDISRSYGPVLGICVALPLLATAMVFRPAPKQAEAMGG